MKKRRGVVVLRQRHDYDCGVASLAMLLGKTYGDVAETTRRIFGSTCPCRRGLGLYHLETIAAGFDRPLRRIYRSTDYLVGRTGVLGLVGGDMMWCGHWVVLKAGAAIVDPDDGAVWTVPDYLAANKCRTATLLVEA